MLTWPLFPSEQGIKHHCRPVFISNEAQLSLNNGVIVRLARIDPQKIPFAGIVPHYTLETMDVFVSVHAVFFKRAELTLTDLK